MLWNLHVPLSDLLNETCHFVIPSFVEGKEGEIIFILSPAPNWKLSSYREREMDMSKLLVLFKANLTLATY
jgi:hypothetical protein